MVSSRALRRALGLAVGLSALITIVACGSKSDGSDDGAGSDDTASTAFVPGEAPTQPPIAPGAGPPGPNPNGDGNEKDAAPPPDAATDTKPDAPADATGQ